MVAQEQANEQRLAMEKQMLSLQQGFKDTMEKQERQFKRFQEQQMAAPAAVMDTAGGGVGGRSGGVGASGGGSEAGSSDMGRSRQKKKARVSDAVGKVATDVGEDEEDEQEEDRLPCEYPGCAVTFKICSTTRATMSNHMHRDHPQVHEAADVSEHTISLYLIFYMRQQPSRPFNHSSKIFRINMHTYTPSPDVCHS